MKNQITKKIAVGTLKGGVGKSSCVVSLGSILAERGFSVLIVDGDPQANSTSYLGLDETVQGYTSIKNIYDDKNTKPADIVKHTQIENLDVIGSTILLTENEGKLYTLPLPELYLRKYFTSNEDFFNNYDYILFDTNPSMSKLNQSIFATADKIICISDASVSAYKGIEMFDYLLDKLMDAADLDIKIEALLLNKLDIRTKMTKDYIEFVHEDDLTKDILLESLVKVSVKLTEAELNQNPINYYAPNSVPTLEYNRVVDELFEEGVL